MFNRFILPQVKWFSNNAVTGHQLAKAPSSLAKANTTSCRYLVTSSQGAIFAEPIKTKFGLLKVLAATIPGILLGATLAKNGAAWLEENEIFIPDDDDDDD